jgi:hypothetical protein
VRQSESEPARQDRLIEAFGKTQTNKQASRVLRRKRRESKGEPYVSPRHPGSRRTRTDRLTPHRFLSSVDFTRSLQARSLSPRSPFFVVLVLPPEM